MTDDPSCIHSSMPENHTLQPSTVREEFPLGGFFSGKLLQIHPVEIKTGLIEIEENPFIFGRDAYLQPHDCGTIGFEEARKD